ncbi:MAG: class I SAM-dependent methyltransferase [Nitrospinae bacterium]|nr:class I SAM-dependent methyltransferase [Nitrospinota bacterium]
MLRRFYSRVIFPRLMDFSLNRPEVAELRKRILAEVTGDTLEIGFGTGLNLPHYPPEIRSVSALEPNEGMNGLALRRIRDSQIEVKHLHHDGEEIPVADGSFDSVVSTWTLCSVGDPPEVLREVSRTLRPGGRFFFLEHGLAQNPRIQKWQHRLTPINKIIADGCHLNRDIKSIVETEGLRIVRHERLNLKDAPRILGELYIGVAQKG